MTSQATTQTGPTTLGDELLLLALAAEGADDNAVDVSLAGAQLMELDLLGRIDVVDERVSVLDTRPTGRRDLDGVLGRIDDRRSKKVDEWIYDLSGKVRGALLEHLLATGSVVEQRRRVLGLFRSTDHVPADPALVAAVTARVGAAMQGSEVSDRDAALLALVDSAGLGAAVLPGVEPEAVQARLSALAAPDWAGAGARRVVVAVRFAVGAVVASTAISSGVAAGNTILLGGNN